MQEDFYIWTYIVTSVLFVMVISIMDLKPLPADTVFILIKVIKVYTIP